MLSRKFCRVFCLQLMWITFANASSYLTPGDYELCENEYFSASCSLGTVIMFTYAVYGRMEKSRCLKTNSLIGHQVDVSIQLELQCAGRQQCNVGVIQFQDQFFDQTGIETPGYLKVNYSCLPVQYSSGENRWCISGRSTEILVENGYLSSEISAQTGQGLERCPWFIKGIKGQNVSISLLDFSTSSNSTDGRNCKAWVQSPTSSSPRKPLGCGGRSRESDVHWSDDGKDLFIHFVNVAATANRSYFLLHFKVFRPPRCSNYAPPNNVMVENVETNYSIKVRCVEDISRQRTWTASCENGEWIELSKQECFGFGGRTSASINATTQKPESGSFVTVLIIVIVIMVCVLCASMAGVVLYIKRNKKVDLQSAMINQDAAMQPSQAQHMMFSSQKDLLDFCNNTQTPFPCPQHYYRDYATTLEMRRFGNPMMVGSAHDMRYQMNQQNPGVWTTSNSTPCSHHRPFYTGTSTVGRRPVNHIYELPMGEEDEEGICCPSSNAAWMPQNFMPYPQRPPYGVMTANGLSNAFDCRHYPPQQTNATENVQPSSPFYNELEPFSNIGSNTDTIEAGVEVSAETQLPADHQLQSPPPIPLTRL